MVDKFEYVYEKYKRLLFAKAFDILRDHALAEDAVSEAYIRAYRHLDKIQDPDSNQTAAYLVTIAKNVSITLYHKERRSFSVDIDEYQGADDFNLEELITSQDEAARVMTLVDSLKEEHKAVFLLKYAQDMSHKEIADVLGITENNVTVRLHRAKNKLMQAYKNESREVRI